MIKRAVNKAKRLIAPYITFNKKRRFEKAAIPLGECERLIVIETTFGWDGIMRQRPQQIASCYPEGTLVLYHSAKDGYADGDCIKKIKDGLYVLNLDLYRDILTEAAKNVRKRFLTVYSTDPVPMGVIKKYESAGFRLIYEYVDDLDPTLSGKRVFKKLERKHRHMMDKKVLTVCTATRLYDNVKDLTNALLVTNGCDYEHFKARGHSCPADMTNGSKKPVLGYYGAVASWMDFDILKKLAETGRYEIVLLGVDYDGSFGKSGISTYENIHFLGRKSYEELPSYAAYFDVCMIPFLKNSITKATSPVKLFEYMAAEKPIVTTDLDECLKYESVICASGADGFLAAVEKAYALRDDAEYKALLRKEAMENSWDKKCRMIIELTEENDG